MGKPESLITFVKDRPGHDRRYAIDSTKVEKELGWTRTYDFESGMEETINWYLNNQDWMEDVLSGNYQRAYENSLDGRFETPKNVFKDDADYQKKKELKNNE